MGNGTFGGMTLENMDCTSAEILDQAMQMLQDPNTRVELFDRLDMVEGNKGILSLSADGKTIKLDKSDIDTLKRAYPDSFPGDDGVILDRDGKPVQQDNYGIPEEGRQLNYNDITIDEDSNSYISEPVCGPDDPKPGVPKEIEPALPPAMS